MDPVESGDLYYLLDSDYAIVTNNVSYDNLRTVIIPPDIEIDGKSYSVVAIDDEAFNTCYDLISISIPSSVKTIGFSAFSDCENLTTVTLNSGLESIGNYTFINCRNLTSISIPSSVKTIGEYAFIDCKNLTTITLNFGLESIDAYTFNSCISLTSISIPSSVTTINRSAFGYCDSLTVVTIPSSVTTIGNEAFIALSDYHINMRVNFSTPSGFNLPTMQTDSFGSIDFFGNTGPPRGTAFYNDGVRSSDGTTITDYQAYFQGFGFADASPNEAPCFKEDTKILTDKGYLCIQDLRKGDLVKTLNHNYLPIVMIGKRDLYHHGKKERIRDQLYKCRKEEYPEIFEDLIITGGHSILIDDYFSEEQKERSLEFIHAVDELIDNKIRLLAFIDERASVYDKPGNYTIYHLALENDDDNMNCGIYANGLLVEACSKNYLKEHSNMILID